jgi:hypothetical protein
MHPLIPLTERHNHVSNYRKSQSLVERDIVHGDNVSLYFLGYSSDLETIEYFHSYSMTVYSKKALQHSSQCRQVPFTDAEK